MLDLYVCLRPVRWFKGVPSPVRHPEKVDMVIFRENTEDIYAGIEFEAGTRGRGEGPRLPESRRSPSPTRRSASPASAAIGIKPVSREGTERLVRAAIEYALGQQAQEPHPRPQGQHHEVHRGRLPRPGATPWPSASSRRRPTPGSSGSARRLAKGEAAANDEQKAALAAGRILVKDAIADITLQQVLTRPDDFDVIATLNLNGDYLSDALAAQVGGIGIAPGGNINYVTGHAIFEATHGTAPKYANQDKVNPGSVVLSGEMMLRYLGWTEAADLILKGMDGAIGAKTVTYDFARLMEGATEVKCSEFGDAVIAHM